MPEFSSPELRRGPSQRPRIVANLAFAEILIVWSLRQMLARTDDEGFQESRIAESLSRAFGLARVEDALTALTALASGLCGEGRLGDRFAAVDDDRVTATEEAVLATLAAYQHRESGRAGRLIEWLVQRPAQQRLAAAAHGLATIMTEAGHRLPNNRGQDPRLQSALLMSPQSTPGAQQADLPHAGGSESLTAPERHLLLGLRLWVGAFKDSKDALGAVRQYFGHDAGTDAGLSLHAILRNTTLTALRQVDVRCRQCPGLSADEARLLDSIARLQRDNVDAHELALAAWMPPGALRFSLDAARGLAMALSFQGQILPRRRWDFAALEATVARRTAGAGPADLHPQDALHLQNVVAPTLH